MENIIWMLQLLLLNQLVGVISGMNEANPIIYLILPSTILTNDIHFTDKENWKD